MPERRVVIDHMSIGVSDLARSRDFYRTVLEPLGMKELSPWSDDYREVPFGPEGFDDFAISLEYEVGGQLHIAFSADSEDQVRAFHAAALEWGARDNGAPGPRREYSDGYFGAFVLDPDGHNVEAVYHADEPYPKD
jgi:catechol 2,3-dioxygenase-like lactoylglutathione lyase family enzyme